MSYRVVVVADPRLVHLFEEAADGMRWHGWTVGAGAVMAATTTRVATVAGRLASDWAGDEIRCLFAATSTELVARPATATLQSFRIATPYGSMAPRLRTSNRCPCCGFVHAIGRRARSSAASFTTTDLLIADYPRREIIHAIRDHPPGLGAILVLEDQSALRFASIADLVAGIAVFDTVIASPRVAFSLARRLRVSPHELAKSLGVGEVIQAVSDVEDLRSHAIPWSPSQGLDQVALAVTSAIGRRTDWRTDLQRIPSRLRSDPTTVADLRQQVADRCPVCRSPTNARKAEPPRGGRSPGAFHNLGWLRRRIFNAADNEQAQAAARQMLTWTGSAYVLGSGGSAVAAAFVAQLLNEYGGVFATPMTPSDYVATGRATDALVLISYSGSTADHLPVIQRAREIGVQRIALLTASTHPGLAVHLGPAGLLVSYGNHRRRTRSERGFVSLAATVAPCAVMFAAAAGQTALSAIDDAHRSIEVADRDLSRELAKGLLDGRETHLLGSGYARFAMLDLESKWAEGDIGPLVLHQSKDFSHGRFLSLLGTWRQIQPLVLAVGSDRYEEELVRVLAAEHLASFGNLAAPLVLAARHPDLLGSLELLVRVQSIAAWTAEGVGRDLSRPEYIDPQGLRLYRWKARTLEVNPKLF